MEQILQRSESDRSATGVQELSNAQLAAAIKQAVENGSLQFTCCLVKHVPFMLEGPLRPVTLPCCGFTVSFAGSQDLIAAGKCSFCNAPLAKGDSFVDDDKAARVVAAEGHGYSPQEIQSSEVELGAELGRGTEGLVVKGTYRGKAVAVKKIFLPGSSGVRAIASVKAIIATTYMASIASEHVCRLVGVCWTEEELWCALHCCVWPEASAFSCALF